MTLAASSVLASMFQMSLTATAIRLIEYGSFPAILVCNDTSGRKWFSRGPAVPELVWPLDQPGVGTVAYDLLRGAGARGPTEVYADQWLKSTDARSYHLCEDSALVGPGLVLSMLWWRNERPLVELEDLSERRAARRSDGRDDW